MKQSYHYDSPAGRIYIAESYGAITEVVFHPVESAVIEETPLISRAIEMLREYFGGRRKSFDLPLSPSGTAFQKKAGMRCF